MDSLGISFGAVLLGEVGSIKVIHGKKNASEALRSGWTVGSSWSRENESDRTSDPTCLDGSK